MDVPEIVERVARAFCVADACDPDHQSNDPFDEGARLWTLYVPDARASIEAIMEMDGRMWVAGRDEFVKQADRFNAADRHEMASAIADRAPEHIFKAMLSEALSPSLKEQERT